MLINDLNDIIVSCGVAAVALQSADKFMVQVALCQAAHFSLLSFVLEPQSQQACKIDELVHGLLLRAQLGGRGFCVM